MGSAKNIYRNLIDNVSVDHPDSLSDKFKPGYEHKAPGYAKRVKQLEKEGLTTSDAQGAADAEVMSGEYKKWKF